MTITEMETRLCLLTKQRGRSDSSPTGDRAGRGPGRVAPEHETSDG